MRTGYSQAQIALHWVVVVLVGLQFLLSDGMNRAFGALEQGGIPEPNPLSNLHIFMGFTVFLLILVRLGLRVNHGTPPPHEAEPPLLQKAAKAAHWAFYILLILLPISGAVAWFRSSSPAAEVHDLLQGALIALIVLHVAAALFHHFVLKTNVLKRILKPEG